jgi:hypothetical protein
VIECEGEIDECFAREPSAGSLLALEKGQEISFPIPAVAASGSIHRNQPGIAPPAQSRLPDTEKTSCLLDTEPLIAGLVGLRVMLLSKCLPSCHR